MLSYRAWLPARARETEDRLRKPRAVPIALAVLAAACARQQAPPTAAPPPLTEAELNKPLPSPLPEVAARVNGQPVSTRNVALAARQGAGSEALKPDAQPAKLRDAMYKLITRELLFQEATGRGLVPDEKGVEQAYNEARLPYKDDAAWAAALSQQALDPQSFRQELRVKFTVQALLQQEEAKFPAVPDQEVFVFYNTNTSLFDSGERLKARHILFRVPKDMSPDTRLKLKAKAEEVLKKLRAGADFAALAKQYSEDPASASKGGELLAFSRGQMVKPFEEAAFALKPGETSDLIETPFGYQILRLDKRLPPIQYPFEQVKPQIQKRLLEERRHKNLEALLGTLRAKAKIETYL